MRGYRYYTNLFLFLCILLLHQVTQMSSASLTIHRFLKKYNFPENGTRPKNLSEFIEYIPANFPHEIANLTVVNEMEEHESTGRIITTKLKTHLYVENKKNISQTSKLGEQKGNVEAKYNVTADPLSDIEYLPLGISLDDPNGWQKKWFAHGKVEPNETKYSLSDLEYVPGGVELHDSAVWEKILYGGGTEEPDETEILLDKTEYMPGALSFDDDDWKKKWYSRVKVERNETKASLSDIEYVPGGLSLDNPSSLKWFGHSEEPDKTKESVSKTRYIPRTLEFDNSNSGEIKWYGIDGKAESRESDQHGIDIDYISAELPSGNPDDSGEIWYGPGKVEKLFHNNGELLWMRFPEIRNSLADEVVSEEPKLTNSREEPKSSAHENVPEEPKSSTDVDILKSIEFTSDSLKNHDHRIVAKDVRHSNAAKARQFVFHPYLPYGKDVPEDEKLKLGDVLPIRMVKFVKSMVEEAPWEQMFIKMVRMVVDQFVDKIIEKMFAGKGGGHFKKRSLDVFLSPSWVPHEFETTPVIRMKRSISANKQPDQDGNEDVFAIVPTKRDSQDTDSKGKKDGEENQTWLDHFLDLVFPSSKSDIPGDKNFDRLRKRDTNNAQLFKILVAYFLNSFGKTSGIIADAKDTLRYKMLNEFLPYLYQKRFLKPDISGSSSNSVETIKMSHRKMAGEFQNRNDILENMATRSERHKRSTREHDRQEDEERVLWQATSRRHKPHHHRSRDECSLRKACNAGRLLSRLPSIENITLQLKSHENEPHWDALLWGMKRKRCSKVFCKRQRSPKGSRHSWIPEKGRPSRRIEIVTEAPSESVEIDNLTS